MGTQLGFRLSVVALTVLAGVASLVGAARLLGAPDWADPAAPDPAAGLRVQQRLAELVLRGSGISSRTDPVVIETAELNAFLAQHIESRRLALRPLRVRTEPGRVEVSGRTSLGRVLAESRGAGLVSRLPLAVQELELWLSAEGRLVVREGEGAFVVERAAVGRQPVPPAVLWRLLNIDPRESLTWRVPRIVERIDVEAGRLLIYTRPGRAADGAGDPARRRPLARG